ncbi:hypothetical protein PCE1_003615 [Barthelona sp. PCE]
MESERALKTAPIGKVCTLGQAYAGKTTLIYRFTENEFNSATAPTLGVCFATKNVELTEEGLVVPLKIYDTAGEEKFTSLSRIYYRGADVAAVCYDMSNKDSWDRVKFWVDQLQKNNDNSHCRIYIVGLKADLIADLDESQHPISPQVVEQFAHEIHARTFVTSALTGIGVVELFEEIARDIASVSTQSQIDEPNIFQLDDEQEDPICWC